MRVELVPEVAASCEDHCHACLVAGVDRCLVVLRSAWLDHCPYAGVERQLWAVWEWEECVACHDSVVEPELGGVRLLDRDPDRVDAAHLPRADPDAAQVLGENDCVRPH